jgi:phosphate transport system substrate-binding protein
MRRRLALVVAAAVACAGADAPPRIDLTGAGATFPYPLYSQWFSRYLEETGVRINYQSIGSGGGVRQLAEGTVDFGASDIPLPDSALQAGPGTVVQLPMVTGAVAIVYHLPGVTTPLRLDAATTADLFLGRIARWDDARVAALNPGVALPPDPVVVVHRADASGTTQVFTEWLAAASLRWRDGPGTGRSVAFPVGIGARGNEGVAAQVKATPYAIGYAELTYARQGRLGVAAVQTRAGTFVLPTPASAAAAALAATRGLPDDADLRISLVDAPDPEAYPIVSFSWLLFRHAADAAAAETRLLEFLRWAMQRGTDDTVALDYAPLPPAVAARVQATIDSLAGGR